MCGGATDLSRSCDVIGHMTIRLTDDLLYLRWLSYCWYKELKLQNSDRERERERARRCGQRQREGERYQSNRLLAAAWTNRSESDNGH